MFVIKIIPMAAKKNKDDKYYWVWPVAWGPMGAVASDKGITRLVLPTIYSRDDLKALLAWEHPNAQPIEGPFCELIALTRDYFNGRCVSFADIPCDIPAESTFTGKVLRQCMKIPQGQTVSYLDLSKAIGSLDSSRAVATAMGKNTIPLVIPCHRVIYSSGQLGGYSAPGGVKLKQRLLAHEQSTSS